jgi:phosphomannomutase
MAAPFKAYDIRGIVGEDLSPERARLIGLALAQELFSNSAPPSEVLEGGSERPRIVISRDMRTHSPALSEALAQGLCEGGCDVLDIGLAATPMNYWANVHFEARGSVAVTASHNGPRYNGFKVSGPGAVPIDYSTGLDRVEAQVRAWESNPTPPSASGGRGTLQTETDALTRYLGWMDSFLAREGKPLKIGVDTANGMGGFFLPDWFSSRPWLQCVPLYFELDGTFPNHEADPLKAENLRDVQALVSREGCDFGAAFDGDADRCMFVDENGASISSDLITALIAAHILEETPGSAILYDLRSSRIVPEWIEKHGGTPVRERVGHTFMKRTLRARDARFGGELSGHYYFQDCFNTDSGLMALVQIVNILQKSGRPLSELVAPLRGYSATGEINFRVPDAREMMGHVRATFAAQGAQIDELDGLSVDFPDWWLNLRASNTEPLLRLNLEAASPEERDQKFAIVRGLIVAHGGEEAAGH